MTVTTERARTRTSSTGTNGLGTAQGGPGGPDPRTAGLVAALAGGATLLAAGGLALALTLGVEDEPSVPSPTAPTPEPTRVPTASLPAAGPTTTPAPRPTASLPVAGPTTTPAPRPTASLPAAGPTTTPAPRPTAP
jgi:hypothetical protein